MNGTNVAKIGIFDSRLPGKKIRIPIPLKVLESLSPVL